LLLLHRSVDFGIDPFPPFSIGFNSTIFNILNQQQKTQSEADPIGPC